MSHPYIGLPSERFWNKGVANQHPFTIENLYKKKFSINHDMKIATAGSCFAQHIGKQLLAAGCNVLDGEPAPFKMSKDLSTKYGYGIYSARYGNIYLTPQLLQLAREAFEGLVLEDTVWEKAGRYYDAFRPSVEPKGLESPEEVIAHRNKHLEAVRQVFSEMNVFIFTLGLTEGWVNKKTKAVYPTAPGTIAGKYDEDTYEFHNFRAQEVKNAFLEFRKIIKKVNPNVKFLLTVSPVPLAATATNNHVLVATTYSKSVLRTVAGELTAYKDIDYFPSYELISSSFSRGMFYSPDMRNIEAKGVESVMRVFFSEHNLKKRSLVSGQMGKKDNEVVCEEALLGAFAK